MVKAQYLYAMAQAVSRPSVNEESRVRSEARPCEIFGSRSGTGTGFLRVLQLSPVSMIPPMCLHVALTIKTNGRSLGASPKQCYFRNRGALHRQVLSPLSPLTAAPWHRRLVPATLNSCSYEVRLCPAQLKF